MNVIINLNKKVVNVDNKEYKIVYNCDLQLGDHCCADYGQEIFILFNVETLEHYKLHSEYNVYEDDETESYKRDYTKWNIEKLN